MNSKVVATSFEPLLTVQSRQLAEDNIERLHLFTDVHVVHEIDGTKLGNCQSLRELSSFYDKVIFNFPHTGGKSKIQCNRELLKEFFVSLVSSKLLSETGVVQLTLCRGQGGTPGDDSQRGYENSWKVVEMAAEGGLVLDCVEPFNPSEYPGYIPTGYRGHSDKGFCVNGALCHVFRFPRLSGPSLYPPCYKHDISFWCYGGTFGLAEFSVLVDGVVSKSVGCEVDEFCVENVELLEEYEPCSIVEGCKKTVKENCGRGVAGVSDVGDVSEAVKVGYCYRVRYQCSWAPLSRSMAGQLQQLVRHAVSLQAQLELR